MLSTATSPRNSRQFSTKTAVFLSSQPCWQRGNRCQSPIISAATKADLPAFLLCCPRQPARKTAASLQPRQPFFFLLRKKEKVGGKKKESFAYGKSRNAVRRLRRGKRRFMLPTGTASVIPQCRKVGIAVMEHRRNIEDIVL